VIEDDFEHLSTLELSLFMSLMANT